MRDYEHRVTILYKGRLAVGRYAVSIREDLLTVWTEHGRTSAYIGLSKPHGLAKMLLHELARERKA